MIEARPFPATNLLSHTSGSFLEEATRRDVPAPEALRLYRAGFRDGTLDADWLMQPDMPVIRTETAGVTTKFAQRLAPLAGDTRRLPLETESVILPQSSRAGRRRQALCVSPQVGCAMGCTFCETAQMGLLRQLEPEEIVAQWWAATFALGAQIDNIVFMGMGEPMDNLDTVLSAIEILTDHNGASIPASRITVSTVGRTAGIRRLATFARRPGFRRLCLAVSLNAPNDTVRSAIMPLNRAEPMADLAAAMHEWTVPGRRVLVEYVLIPGVNDGDGHARELAEYLAGLPCTVNIIPYNPRRDSPWPAPSEAEVDHFLDALRATGTRVQRRRTLGRDVMAACGQLGNPEVRRRQRVSSDSGSLPVLDTPRRAATDERPRVLGP